METATGRNKVQKQLWRALCLAAHQGRAVSLDEAVQLTACSRDYVKRYFRWLARQGAAVRSGGAQALYRKTADWPEDQRPHWFRRGEEGRAPVAPQTPAPQAAPAEAGGQSEAPAAGPYQDARVLDLLAEKLGRAAAVMHEVQDLLAQHAAYLGEAQDLLARITGAEEDGHD